MRIVTYNIHRTVGSDGCPDATRISTVLKEIDADLIALQEVGYRHDDPAHLLNALSDALAVSVIEGVTLLDERGHYGNAVLTRLPVAAIRRHDISVAGREQRGVIDLHLNTQGVALQVMATHLGLRAYERRFQVERLISLLDASTAGVKILLGDFNEWFPWSGTLRRLRRTFGRLPAVPTFPARSPILALDRIGVQPASVIANVYAYRSPLARSASDHLPLVAELNLR
jgi:endonuclease/exonuclease/phosphatase family metal-dependent hydrolase